MTAFYFIIVHPSSRLSIPYEYIHYIVVQLCTHTLAQTYPIRSTNRDEINSFDGCVMIRVASRTATDDTREISKPGL